MGLSVVSGIFFILYYNYLKFVVNWLPVYKIVHGDYLAYLSTPNLEQQLFIQLC